MDPEFKTVNDSCSDVDEGWTRLEFSERRRTPYSFNSPSTEDKEPTMVSPGSFPEDPDDFPTGSTSGTSYAQQSSGFDSSHHNFSGTSAQSNSQQASGTADAAPRPPPKPRKCRICLDIVHPTVEDNSIPSIPGFAPRPPRFIFEDPELGRLISPCKCKGSSKYVHEACLKEWRMASPSRDRNYWHCPTCGYNYRLERLTWANYVQSVPSQLVLTFVVFVMAMFVMGFVADPIINLYLDPWSLFGWGWSGASPLDPIENIFDEEDAGSWFEHFFKGMAGIGVLGFVKFWLASPFRYLRSTIGGGNTRATGRDRMENLSWIVILVGIGTTLYAIYTGVRAFSRRTLMLTAERVLDVGGDDGEDDDENNE